MKNIIPFNYAGNKLFLIEYLSELIKNKSFKNYIENAVFFRLRSSYLGG
jgi:site-specific DNA-adenine methylase